MRLRLLSLLLFLALSGCDTAGDAPVLRAPGGQTPVAGAIAFRGVSNEDLGVIGAGPVGGHLGTLNPPGNSGTGGDGGVVTPDRFDFSTLYPNPTAGRTTISFVLPGATEVSVFVVAALPLGRTAPPQASSAQGAWVYRPGGLPVAVLERRSLRPGQYALPLDLAEAAGRPLPAGYYRVYVQTPYVLAWQDLLYDPTFFSPF